MSLSIALVETWLESMRFYIKVLAPTLDNKMKLQKGVICTSWRPLEQSDFKKAYKQKWVVVLKLQLILLIGYLSLFWETNHLLRCCKIG